MKTQLVILLLSALAAVALCYGDSSDSGHSDSSSSDSSSSDSSSSDSSSSDSSKRFVPRCRPLRPHRYGGYRPVQRYYSVGSKVYFLCNKGFALSGSSFAQCVHYNYRTFWKFPGFFPVCKPITCPDLSDPRYGDVRVTGNRFGDKATYSCDKGFVLKGNSKRSCQSNGYWSGDAPTCVPIDCGRLRDPKYGDVSFKCTTVGCTAWYSCDRGFVLKGPKDRRCQSNGHWSDDMPSCVRKYY